MIRFHSFYPWHCSGDYDYLCNDEDKEMLKWVKEFKYVLPKSDRPLVNIIINVFYFNNTDCFGLLFLCMYRSVNFLTALIGVQSFVYKYNRV